VSENNFGKFSVNTFQIFLVFYVVDRVDPMKKVAFEVLFSLFSIDTEAVYQEATFYCAGTDSVDLCPKAEPLE
jgi:hypothetical protein